jgi:hypothetical protein
MFGHDLGGGDGLYRFAQAHFIADEASPGTGREKRALALIVIQRHIHKLVQRGAADSLGK